jgi:hypothetical protein
MVALVMVVVVVLLVWVGLVAMVVADMFPTII